MNQNRWYRHHIDKTRDNDLFEVYLHAKLVEFGTAEMEKLSHFDSSKHTEQKERSSRNEVLFRLI